MRCAATSIARAHLLVEFALDLALCCVRQLRKLFEDGGLGLFEIEPLIARGVKLCKELLHALRHLPLPLRRNWHGHGQVAHRASQARAAPI